MPSGTLIFDVETHSADLLYTMPPEEFVRLIGYKWLGDREVTLTTDLEELRAAIRSARWIIGHNLHMFDLRAVFGIRSDEPLELARQRRVCDTFVHAVLVNPAPNTYVNRHGKQALADSPAKMRAWFSLDEQAYQLGVKGKTDDLKALAKEFGGYGEIPVDDERYRSYLVGDVEASEAVAKALLAKGPLDDYAMREQEIAARAAVISSNGFRVDRKRAQARVDELAARREVILADLQERYGLPADGSAPWATDPGKVAILAALADHGITPDTVDWPKTPTWEKREEKKAESLAKAADKRARAAQWRQELDTRELPPRSISARHKRIKSAEEEAAELEARPLPPAFGLSLGGEELIGITKGTPAEDLGRALAELKGQRSLAQLALDSCHPDGLVHPEITMLQRSGRWSTTDPGLTIWSARGEGAVEKAYFVPDNGDEVLFGIDLSNADARVVAWLSGDRKFAERFEPGADGHMINAYAAWGREVVDSDVKRYRQMAKPLGHGWNYGGQAKTLSKVSGVPLKEAKKFCDGMAAAFSRLVAWQNAVRKEAQKGYVMNPWGRKMWVERGREFTQAPALKGQSGTRELICDALLKMPPWALRRVKAQIHDELIFSVPRATFEKWSAYFVGVMETTMPAPPGGMEMHFPASASPPGENWQEASEH